MPSLLEQLRAKYQAEISTLDRVLVRIGPHPVAAEIIKMRGETEEKLHRVTPQRMR